jgi:hypothetical protein
MTAKSETVGVILTDEQVVIAQGLFIYEVDYSPEESWRGVRLDNVRKLIDKHEVAMAELQAGYERMDAAYLAQWSATVDAEAKLTTLISGLEALAGECLDSSKYGGYTIDERQVYIDMTVKLRSLIPAAANTESEETK